MSAGRWFAGLMSGTSLDGTDAVLVRFANPPGTGIAELHHHHRPFDADLRNVLLRLQTPGPDELTTASLAANRVAEHYAETLLALCESCGISASALAAIGAHGQTVRHQPELGFTVQLLNGSLLAELTGTPVVCDLRSRDVAAGGQGAPLVPAFHAALWQSTEARVIANIGGMANLTRLHPDHAVTGFDCGPGNVLMDAWIDRCRGLAYDHNGEWAASGSVQDSLLRHLREHPFFKKAPPKSCGREDFDLPWLLERLSSDPQRPEPLRDVDVQATLAEFTASTLADSVTTHAAGSHRLLVCGGGAHNAHLLARLAAHLPDMVVETTADHGLAPTHVEAAAFAWLAQQRLLAEPGNLPAVTGARGPRVLGALYSA